MTEPTPPMLPQSYARAVFRMLGLIVLALVGVLPVTVLYLLKWERARARAVRLFYSICCWIVGVRVTSIGTLSQSKPLMVIANHTSYLDIFVLGSRTALSFTPKLEIRSWPVIGFFCVLADCVFIERKPADMQRAQAEMAERLQAGKVIALFPEGTTGDGFHVKPFKSGFLSLVEAHDLPLQPISMAYTHIGTTPLCAATREQVAWIGEASLVTHLMRLLSFPYIQVTLAIHSVERIQDYEDRKALAKSCETIITDGLNRLLERNGVLG